MEPHGTEPSSMKTGRPDPRFQIPKKDDKRTKVRQRNRPSRMTPWPRYAARAKRENRAVAANRGDHPGVPKTPAATFGRPSGTTTQHPTPTAPTPRLGSRETIAPAAATAVRCGKPKPSRKPWEPRQAPRGHNAPAVSGSPLLRVPQPPRREPCAPIRLQLKAAQVEATRPQNRQQERGRVEKTLHDGDKTPRSDTHGKG